MIPPEVRAHLSWFFHSLQNEFWNRKNFINLTTHQQAAVKFLDNHLELVVLKTDKNLGPAIIEHIHYIQMAYRDHLNDHTTYWNLSFSQAVNRIKAIWHILLSFISKFLQGAHNEDDRKYLEQYLDHYEQDRLKNSQPTFARFYLLAKIHKCPLKSRPIVSVLGSITDGIGQWIDKELQTLFSNSRHMFPFFLKSSRELITDATNLVLLPHAKLFTCDAISMYTNIDTNHALQVIGDSIWNLPPDIDIHPGLLPGLEIVMSHCVFQFGPEFFVQVTGTAMGVPPAPMYATMYFAVHENNIIYKYLPHLPFFRHYIDDRLGIWIDNNNRELFNQFCQEMDNFSLLQWEFSDFSLSTAFLDVILHIEGHKITTRMHEKLLNLHLYIPPHSANALGVLKSIIYGPFQQVNYLCSNPTYVRQYIQLLFNWLCAPGYTPKLLQPIFKGAMMKYNTPLIQGSDQTDDNKCPLFLHIKYHPLNPSLTSVQQIYRETLCQCSDIWNHNDYEYELDRLIVAYHWPTNLASWFSNQKIMFTHGTYGQINPWQQ